MPTIDSVPEQTLNVASGSISYLAVVASDISDPSTVSVQLQGDDASMFDVGSTTATETETPGTYDLSTELTGTLPPGDPYPTSPSLTVTVTADGATSPQWPVPANYIDPQGP